MATRSKLSGACRIIILCRFVLIVSLLVFVLVLFVCLFVYLGGGVDGLVGGFFGSLNYFFGLEIVENI